MDNVIFVPGQFLSTLSLRRATQTKQTPKPTKEISIHALLAESDADTTPGTASARDFYPRSPCGERPYKTKHTTNPKNNFYPRSPCGERPGHTFWGQAYQYFYPRSPCGERPSIHCCAPPYKCISIHALLAESDGPVSFFNTFFINFYPRSPCGERPPKLSRVVPTPIFLSTLSLRRATDAERGERLCYTISIHALLAESDRQMRHCKKLRRSFLSTLSLRRATGVILSLNTQQRFLSTLSLRRAT